MTSTMMTDTMATGAVTLQSAPSGGPAASAPVSTARLSADERRRQLIECALDVAERGGIGAVTVRAIAREAGISLGMVHYCFASKEALLTEMAERLVYELSTASQMVLAAVGDATQADGRAGLRELVRIGLKAMWSIVEANPNRRLLTYEIATHAMRLREAGSPDAGDVVGEQYRMMDREVTAFLVECADRTGMVWTEPVASIAHRSLSIVDGLVLRWLVDRDTDAIALGLAEVANAIAAKAVES
ncbi:AcrR family transcriptional regulator [Rhodococcus sp. PvR044]|jgi:AcrR family transcriptional regulator|uniref:TetR/AcrR family transcriptional regulator n=1 Tax=Rhodococcus TaxID=1827 RepID=UPI000BD80AE2|nr:MULTISPECIES: TetR/AcrR family transcriptional regulator [Rhodococcus]MBP1158281.1 AcrR family transcriptional regulator [Rhodococcus sp. PvR099]MCZ4554154.1 TetR family transcriptional regulator [Rhodococcus maanshanensis]PTR43718.1 TetR family transcriptional regulator [Rhodococcus sp. OK611]SNX90536.1 transcriptional regulator, TetR family [Rhodococcus sp. OK270]